MSDIDENDGIIESDGPLQTTLQPEDYGKGEELNSFQADLTLVVGSAMKSEQYQVDKQYQLLWRDSDLLFQSPRPMSVYENTYVLEPKQHWAYSL